MAHDYKHARTTSHPGLSASGGFAIGLLLGLSIAAGVYLFDRRPSAQADADKAPLSNEQAGNESSQPTPESAQSDPQFDFYEVLPSMEVEVADDDSGMANGPAAGAIDAPGAYILQVGSYHSAADAERVKAKLAQQGVTAGIQKISIDNDTWHRVRIGPISNLGKLEEIRRTLREAQIDALVIKQR